MKGLHCILPVLVIALWVGIGSANDDHIRARKLMERGEILPLEQLLESLPGNRQWRLLEAELEEEDGVIIYELELLDEEGRVRELKYDARSGVLLSDEGE